MKRTTVSVVATHALLRAEKRDVFHVFTDDGE